MFSDTTSLEKNISYPTEVRLPKRVKERLQKGFERVGKRIVEQVEGELRGEKVTDRIVSYYEEEARALPKGKVHKPCEFGHKVRLDMNGDGYITNWRLCRGNPADVGMLEEAVDMGIEHR